MKKHSKFVDKLRYKIDNLFSKGTAALILSLFLISLVIIILAALIVTVAKLRMTHETTPLTFGEAFWRSLLRTLDAGTMGADTGKGFRLVMFLLPTLAGIFIISTLIGVLSSGIEGKLEELRKGRSKVIENSHYVVLGWSEQIFTIISELIIANQNKSHSTIVILADKDKVEMEDSIRHLVGHLKHTRVVCRSGNPIELTDLGIASLETSKAIIVLSPDEENPDSEVIKIVLAIIRNTNHRATPFHVVAELRDEKNMEAAKLIGKGEVEWVLVGDFIARIIAQTCHQSGLSAIYTELLDFEGDEMYLFADPSLTGKTIGDTLHLFEKNAVFGFKPKDGIASLNPPVNTQIKDGDQIVVIAEDDSKIFMDGKPVIQHDLIVKGSKEIASPEQTLILGWNWRASRIIRELDNYVPPDSKILAVANIDNFEHVAHACCPEIQNQTITFMQGDTCDRKTLDSLNITKYNHIIILAYCDRMVAQKADSITLITLLHLRDIVDQKNGKCTIVSEMLDIRNRNLAEITRADDFIVSDKLVSLLITQIAENKNLSSMFADIFNAEGSEVYLKPAGQYVKLNVPVNFYTIVESAKQRNELAIGYRIKSLVHDPEKMYGVVLNPRKSQEVIFSDQDKIVVAAEEL
jgi:voltage-gated potassium channel Kch